MQILRWSSPSPIVLERTLLDFEKAFVSSFITDWCLLPACLWGHSHSSPLVHSLPLPPEASALFSLIGMANAVLEATPAHDGFSAVQLVTAAVRAAFLKLSCGERGSGDREPLTTWYSSASWPTLFPLLRPPRTSTAHRRQGPLTSP